VRGLRHPRRSWPPCTIQTIRVPHARTLPRDVCCPHRFARVHAISPGYRSARVPTSTSMVGASGSAVGLAVVGVAEGAPV
jgi:hypothetical protein